MCPFKVVCKIGIISYKLLLHKEYRLHHVLALVGISREALICGTGTARMACQMSPISSWWALESPLTLARRGTCSKPSGGQGGGGGAIVDRVAVAAIGVFNTNPTRP